MNELLALFKEDTIKVLFWNDVIVRNFTLDATIEVIPRNAFYRRIIHLLCTYYGYTSESGQLGLYRKRHHYIKRKPMTIHYRVPTTRINFKYLTFRFPLTTKRTNHLLYGYPKLDYSKKMNGLCNIVTHLLWCIFDRYHITGDIRKLIYKNIYN